MADIELVIKIPEEDYDYLYVRKEVDGEELSYHDYLIFKGIQLPKGHGKLIDADTLIYLAETCIETTDAFIGLVQDMPPIIEADEESEEV